jgi:hypothetical protein
MGPQMNHKAALEKSLSLLAERGQDYGDPTFMFETAAKIASLILGKDLSPYDITTILEAVKLARRRVNPALDDNYVDQINYTSFSAAFVVNEFRDTTAAAAKRPQETSNAKSSSGGSIAPVYSGLR